MEFSLTWNCRDKAELCEDRAGERTGRPDTTEVQGQAFQITPRKRKIKITLKIK